METKINSVFELLQKTGRLKETEKLAVAYADGELSEEDFIKLKEERRVLKEEIKKYKSASLLHK